MIAHTDRPIARSAQHRQRGRQARDIAKRNGALQEADRHATNPDRRADYRVAVAPLALILMAYPVISTAAPRFVDILTVGVVALLLPLILGRLGQVAWPALWLLVLVVVYALSSQFGENSFQGFVHTVTLVCMGTVFLTFATYGSAILSLRWVPPVAGAVVALNFIAVGLGDFPKNSTGGALIYVCGLAIVLMIRRSRSTCWVAAIAFTVLGIVLAFEFHFRFLVACSLAFLLAFICATCCQKKWYWLAGIVGSASAVVTVVWFFLNLDRRGLAWKIGQAIMDLTGHRANSGREQIWAYIIYATRDNPIFGLGAGTLPRDILSTNLSGHSYYIQVYLQLGVVGLAVLICFLLAVWRMLARATSAPGRFGSAVFIMFVVHNATEVLMFENSALVAVPAWCTIGLALAIDRDQDIDFPTVNSGVGSRIAPRIDSKTSKPVFQRTHQSEKR